LSNLGFFGLGVYSTEQFGKEILIFRGWRRRSFGEWGWLFDMSTSVEGGGKEPEQTVEGEEGVGGVVMEL